MCLRMIGPMCGQTEVGEDRPVVGRSVPDCQWPDSTMVVASLCLSIVGEDVEMKVWKLWRGEIELCRSRQGFPWPAESTLLCSASWSGLPIGIGPSQRVGRIQGSPFCGHNRLPPFSRHALATHQDPLAPVPSDRQPSGYTEHGAVHREAMAFSSPARFESAVSVGREGSKAGPHSPSAMPVVPVVQFGEAATQACDTPPAPE